MQHNTASRRQLKTFRTATMEQIQVTVEGFNTMALLTRFVGDRTWIVRGTDQFDRYSVELYDGHNTRFTRNTALRLAEQFIRTGREFL